MLRAYTTKEEILDVDALYLERQKLLKAQKARKQGDQVCTISVSIVQKSNLLMSYRKIGNTS